MPSCISNNQTYWPLAQLKLAHIHQAQQALVKSRNSFKVMSFSFMVQLSKRPGLIKRMRLYSKSRGSNQMPHLQEITRAPSLANAHRLETIIHYLHCLLTFWPVLNSLSQRVQYFALIKEEILQPAKTILRIYSRIQ